MADLIKKIKIKKQDGTFTDYIPIGAEAQNISTSDGDSVQLKLNKKPYYYNSVADMKADLKLKAGDMAVTLGYYEPNDGGNGEYRIVSGTHTDDGGSYHVLNNSLYAELIMKDNTVNILQFGATTAMADIGSLINTIINDLNYKLYIPAGTYNITTTIIPNGKKELIIDGNLQYNGNNACIKIASSKNTIITHDIVSTNGIPVLLENNDNTTTKCTNNNIKLNGLIRSTNNHALYLHSILKGICYNEISFMTLSAGLDKYCIYIKTESENTSIAKYVNENIITGGQCVRGAYGVYIDTNTSGSIGEVNGMKFNTISFEGVSKAVFLNNTRSSVFNYIRVGELSGAFIKINGACDGVIFNIMSLVQPSMFDVSEQSNNTSLNCFVNCEVSTSGGNRFGKDIVLSGQKVIVKKYLKEYQFRWVTNTLGTEKIFDNTNDFGNYFNVTNSLGLTLILNESFDPRGIDVCYFKISSDVPNFTCKDHYGNTVLKISTQESSDRYYKAFCYHKDDVNYWMSEQITLVQSS